MTAEEETFLITICPQCGYKFQLAGKDISKGIREIVQKVLKEFSRPKLLWTFSNDGHVTVKRLDDLVVEVGEKKPDIFVRLPSRLARLQRTLSRLIRRGAAA